MLEIACTADSFQLVVFVVLGNVFYLCKVKDLALKAASVHHGRALYAISKEFPAFSSASDFREFSLAVIRCDFEELNKS